MRFHECILTYSVEKSRGSGQALLKEHFIFFHWHFYLTSKPFSETMKEAALQVHLQKIDRCPK